MSCPKCPARQVVDPPNVVFRDYYHPQIVEVIHPIEIVNRHHCVPVPCHVYTVTERDEFCGEALPGDAVVQSVRTKATARTKARRR
ncbi:hypothetical protein B5M42_001955 [Paenibacillus athensensis]|uniref:Uncharacterized protein n=1 Tax=Paenibacillus athensensis TaxID=1967502 RepID=A0A4Y8QCC1_9BACL|nr:hypothetical protein [Paenibacillus athensensis]MCD1257601.1 hypothetical protein [Paenibacillus athensensis]